MTDDAPRRYHRDSIEFARAFAFFDAVYAFALTMLVLNLEPPPGRDWASLGTLLSTKLGYEALGFAISFVVIASFWRVNHRIVAAFSALTPSVIVANIVAIGFIVLIPFSTQGIADEDSADYPLATTVYALNIAFAVLAQSAIHWVGRHGGVLQPAPSIQVELVRTLDVLVTPLVFVLSIPVAFIWGADAARYSWLSLLVLSPISGTLTGRWIRRLESAGTTEGR